MDQIFDDFLTKYPGYAANAALDDLRAREYSRLDRLGQVYLDYTGGGLYAESQFTRHMELLGSGVYGNPHSANPSSLASTKLVDDARKKILEYFNADPGEYVAIFTPNASGALKLVGESYPFEGGQYLLTFDNHNSVNGIREFARYHGATVTYLPVEQSDLRVSEASLLVRLGPEVDPREGAAGRRHKLFAFPAQSNFSSVQHPLRWIELARERGWDVLLDTAAFVPSNRLDLSVWKPDFMPISFYKMFGYPTGIGALLVRREKIRKLRRPWFAGGTITVASVQGDKYYLEDAPMGFEDGTVDYLGIPAVKIGLEFIEKVGVDSIHERTLSLTAWLLENLIESRHGNGKPLVRIYGPKDMDQRGSSMALNFLDSSGGLIDHRLIEKEANLAGISVRTGCFCNPGAGEIALGISRDELAECFHSPEHEERLTLDEFKGCLRGKTNGAVRISFGVASNFTDARKFLEFARGFIGRT